MEGWGGVPVWSRRVRRPRKNSGEGARKRAEEMKRGCRLETLEKRRRRRPLEPSGAQEMRGGGRGGGRARSESEFRVEIERHNNGGSPTNRRVQFWKWMCFRFTSAREKH